jgi:polypeptide N-acetylgalactosaminyltransferase
LFCFDITQTELKYPVATNYERKDWHDWKFIENEKLRVGPGENGTAFHLSDPEDIALNYKLFAIEGLYAIISDKISVNRSVPDTRLPE